MTSARIIELGEITVGIVLPDGRSFRVFAAERRFNALERTSFRSVEQAYAAARRLLRARPSAAAPAPQRLSQLPAACSKRDQLALTRTHCP